MPSWLTGQPFAITFTVLLLIVFARAQLTYWLGRGVIAGAHRTRCHDRLDRPRVAKATIAINRWGWPIVTLSFLTVGVQTAVNAAAGLTRMPFPRYLAAMVPGCIAWALIYATVGIAAIEAALAIGGWWPWIVLGSAIVVGVIVAVLRHRSRARRSDAADEDPYRRV